jgi:alginate O-acetyltransferase complex protein AlgI
MAIGSAHALGFKLPDNFDRPYVAENIRDFWRRWHITLSAWLRDYVYIPLGGNRGSRWRTTRNLLITMALAGLWHGAGGRFVVFGLVHGVWLAIHRLVPWPAWTGHPALRPVRIGTTLTGFALSLVVFRSPSLADGGVMLGRMLTPAAGLVPAPSVLALLAVLGAALWVVHAAGRSRIARRAPSWLPWPVAGSLLALGVALAQLLTPDSGGAFIYFQF